MKGWIILLAMSVCLFASCGEETGFKKYQKLVDKELSKKERTDSVFFGVKLGMTKKEFYLHCWNMNKKGLFTDGADNTAVQYKIPTGMKYPASLNFYPEFRDDKIAKMGASIRYDGWAPWNKHLAADSLILDVVQLYEKWYPDGNPFIKIENEKRGIIHVKVDNNRRIIIGIFDNSHVKVDYTDLSVDGLKPM